MLYNRIMELWQWHLERGSQGPVDLGFEPTEAERRPYAIHQSGKWYTNENIDQMLMERHLNKKARRASGKNHLRGPRNSCRHLAEVDMLQQQVCASGRMMQKNSGRKFLNGLL